MPHLCQDRNVSSSTSRLFHWQDVHKDAEVTVSLGGVPEPQERWEGCNRAPLVIICPRCERWEVTVLHWGCLS